MDLHQLQLTYQVEEDRLLCRASFRDEQGNLQELRAWLTRRLVRALWPGIVNALENQVLLDRPQAAHARADIVGMEHHDSVERIRGSGNFDNPYETTIQAFPLGEDPFLVTTVNFTQHPDQPIKVDMLPAEGHGFEICFTPAILHGFCSLMRDAVDRAEWGLELALPGAATQPPSRLLN